MEKKTFWLINQNIKENACEAIMNAPEGYRVQIQPPTRTLQQNDKLWAMLNEVSKQVEWYGQYYPKEVWKTIFLTAYGVEMRFVPAIDGGQIPIARSSTRLTISQMSDLIEIIYAFGAKHGVRFKENCGVYY